MLAIAGAILINAACILTTTTKEYPDTYLMRLVLNIVGSSLIGADLGNRLVGFVKKQRALARTEKPQAESGAAPDCQQYSP
jgi:hypothetical protein